MMNTFSSLIVSFRTEPSEPATHQQGSGTMSRKIHTRDGHDAKKWKMKNYFFSIPLSLLFCILFLWFFRILHSRACACTGLYTQSFSADILWCSDHRHLGKSRWVSTLVRVCREESCIFCVERECHVKRVNLLWATHARCGMCEESLVGEIVV